ncbi:hypothetical protein B0A64_17160 [Flavobacterium araucananum]|uniref:Uncharacterized protein n=1 Tax=Flavobacterium araucananum TaxID=946678 RepID=A0A227P1S9_9FLAO|nr:hypothetical protein B0A64_17160 [Flavobacterium araucananum]
MACPISPDSIIFATIKERLPNDQEISIGGISIFRNTMILPATLANLNRVLTGGSFIKALISNLKLKEISCFHLKSKQGSCSVSLKLPL